MFTLTKKLQKEQQDKDQEQLNKDKKKGIPPVKKISVRDRLLIKEMQDVQQDLPTSCKLQFEDNDKLHDFFLHISPEEGYWKNGTFTFHVVVPEDYNFAPPTVKCQTRLWHPNINEEGAVCLSLLRIRQSSSADDLGWLPTRRLKDVIWGLNSLFTDLLNFEDPLNGEASEMYQRDPPTFQRKVNEYIDRYCKRENGNRGTRRY